MRNNAKYNVECEKPKKKKVRMVKYQTICRVRGGKSKLQYQKSGMWLPVKTISDEKGELFTYNVQYGKIYRATDF